jgi:hypothetical protein
MNVKKEGAARNPGIAQTNEKPCGVKVADNVYKRAKSSKGPDNLKALETDSGREPYIFDIEKILMQVTVALEKITEYSAATKDKVKEKKLAETVKTMAGQMCANLTKEEFDGDKRGSRSDFIEVIKQCTTKLEDVPEYRAKQIDPTNFKDILYSEDQINIDHNRAVKIVEEMQKINRKNFSVQDLAYEKRLSNDGYRKLLSDAMEASICMVSNYHKWFGECAGQRTAFADDVISKADMVLEVPSLDHTNKKAGNFFAGLKIDVTTANSIEVAAKKEEGTRRLKDYIKGRTGDEKAARRVSVLYYIDKDGNKMKIEPIIPLVLSIDFFEAERLIKFINILLEISDKGSIEAFVANAIMSAHPLRADLVGQMVEQLEILMKEFPSVAKEDGFGFGNKAERVGQQIEKLYKFFRFEQTKEKNSAE